MNVGLDYMNRYTHYAVYAPLAPVKLGGGKWLPVKIITNNTLETIVFGNA